MSLPALAAAASAAASFTQAAAGDPNWPYVKPGSAGAGYSSTRLRVPRWEPEWDISKSTVAMPCNYSGYYDLDSLAGFGYLQFDCAPDQTLQFSLARVAAGCWLPGCWLLAAGCWLATGRFPLWLLAGDRRCLLTATGRWWLVAVAGCWLLLAVGCWLHHCCSDF